MFLFLACADAYEETLWDKYSLELGAVLIVTIMVVGFMKASQIKTAVEKTLTTWATPAGRKPWLSNRGIKIAAASINLGIIALVLALLTGIGINAASRAGHESQHNETTISWGN